jgi:hypothetical protein
MTGTPTTMPTSCTIKSWYGDFPCDRSVMDAVDSTMTRPRLSSSVVIPAMM